METERVLRGLEGLRPAIRARREEIEKARRMPRDLVDDLAKTGLFRLSVPRAVGGQEASPREILRAIETVSTADGSTGWCAMIGTANNLSSGYMSERGAKEVFPDPSKPSAGIAAPAGKAVPSEGGFRLQGRWPFASGVTHVDWLWAGAMVMENGKPRMTPHGPEIIHACVPMKEVQIHDTWFVSGLAGTGSNDVTIADAFVPEHRVFDLFDPAKHRPEPLYQLPSIGWFVSQVVAVSLGIARGALDELIEIAQTKVPTFSAAVLADRPVAQIELARAEAGLDAARSSLYDSVDDLWQTARAGKQPTTRQIARNRAAAIHAAETGASVARTAHVLAGGSSIYTSSSLQRHMRDAEAITHHFTVAPHVWEDAGRVFLDGSRRLRCSEVGCLDACAGCNRVEGPTRSIREGWEDHSCSLSHDGHPSRRPETGRAQTLPGVPGLSWAYVDSSVILAVALDQPGSAEARRRIGRFHGIYASNLAEAEIRSAFAREGIDAEEAEHALASVAWVLPDRPLSPELARALEVGRLRGADLWHVACALYLEPEPDELVFLTLGLAQRAAAVRLGFAV